MWNVVFALFQCLENVSKQGAIYCIWFERKTYGAILLSLSGKSACFAQSNTQVQQKKPTLSNSRFCKGRTWLQWGRTTWTEQKNNSHDNCVKLLLLLLNSLLFLWALTYTYTLPEKLLCAVKKGAISYDLSTHTKLIFRLVSRFWPYNIQFEIKRTYYINFKLNFFCIKFQSCILG